MTTKACAIHRRHDPEPKDNDTHHIVPLSWWPEPANDQTVVLDPTAHRNVHVFIDLLVVGGGNVAWAEAQHFSKAERDLATKGYGQAARMGLTPKRTL